MRWNAAFAVGGAAPLAILPFLLVLPESHQLRHAHATQDAPRNPIAGLFSGGLAQTTLLLWAIFLFNLLSMYLIGYWLPTVLNLGGLSPAEAAATASYGAAGGIISTMALALLLARFRPEWVLACSVGLGMIAIAGIVLGRAEGLMLDALVFCTGAGFVGSQLGLNGFAAAAYPTALRSTGVGWALGVGRLGGILGPILGGVLLGLKFSPSAVLLSVLVPGSLTVAAITILGGTRSASSPGMRWKTSSRLGLQKASRPPRLAPTAANEPSKSGTTLKGTIRCQ
ncbi:MAG: MFS transporter [Rhodopila sp.]